MKKTIRKEKKWKGILLVVIFTLTCIPSVQAAADDPVTLEVLATEAITASGSVPHITNFDVSFVDPSDTSLTFPASGAEDVVVTADEIVKVSFQDNSSGNVAIIVFTDNATLFDPNGTTATGAGLVGVSDNKVSVPLHWVVQESETKAVNNGDFRAFTAQDVTDGIAEEGKEGYVNNVFQPFVVDKAQSNFLTKGVIQYSTIAYNILNKVADLPENSAWCYDDQDSRLEQDTDEYGDPLFDDDGNPIMVYKEGVSARHVSNGDIYLRLATDYHGAKGQDYATNKLTFSLVIVS